MVNPDEEQNRYSISKNYAIDKKKRKILYVRTGKYYDYDETDTKILIYEDRVKTWFFEVAEYLMVKKKIKLPSGKKFDTNESGFVILMIGVSYIEGNQQFRWGRPSRTNETSRIISEALERIFPELSKNLYNLFIKEVRHGFFHDGITRKNIFINASQESIFKYNPKTGSIVINPHLFLKRIEEDFDKYIIELKDDNNPKRANFVKFWDSFKGI